MFTVYFGNIIAPQNVVEMTHPSVLLPTSYELPLHSPFLPAVVFHSAIVCHSAIFP